MKKYALSIMVILILALGTGCSSRIKDADQNTIYVQKDGNISSALIESFDKSYYDAAELETGIRQEVADYNTSAGSERIKIDKLEVADGIAKLYLEYGDYLDYGEFNGMELFAGTVEEAMRVYDFDTTLYAVEKGAIQGEKDKAELDADSKVVILEEPIQIDVTGKILAVSENINLLDKKTAVVAAENTGLAYIIYK